MTTAAPMPRSWRGKRSERASTSWSLTPAPISPRPDCSCPIHPSWIRWSCASESRRRTGTITYRSSSPRGAIQPIVGARAMPARRRPAMTDTVRFMLNDRVEAVRDFDPTMTVLNYLRTVALKRGTKEGCAEGDCGACTVVVGELDGGGVRYRAVNSCILFVPTLDGKQLITVEDLKAPDGGLHPVQQSMVEC